MTHPEVPGQLQFSSVQFSHSVMSDSLGPHELQHARPPCPSPTPRVHSDSRPSPWEAPVVGDKVPGASDTLVTCCLLHAGRSAQPQLESMNIKRSLPGLPWQVQWLKLLTTRAGGLGSIPGRGTRSPMPQLRPASANQLNKY